MNFHFCVDKQLFSNCSLNDAKAIFKAAASHNLTEIGHVWIVTEQLLRSPDIPQGALGIKLLNADNETAHINDSL